MKCQDLEKLLPELLDGAPDSAFQADFESHLRSCPDCSDFVSDLKLISVQARELEACEEPAPRLWLRIAADLRAEGIIHDPVMDAEPAIRRPLLVPAVPRRRWNTRWLVPVAAAILAAGSYTVNHRSTAPTAKLLAPKNTAASPAPVVAAVEKSPVVSTAPVPVQTPREAAAKTVRDRNKGAGTANDHGAEQNTVASAPNLSAPSLEDRQFLTAVSTLSPSMRITYENQLQAVNADIRETQAYVDRNPGDVDARQHLMDAYQQKELLYQIALDRIQ